MFFEEGRTFIVVQLSLLVSFSFDYLSAQSHRSHSHKNLPCERFEDGKCKG